MDTGNYCRTWDYSVWRRKELEGELGSFAQMAAGRGRTNCGPHTPSVPVIMVCIIAFIPGSALFSPLCLFFFLNPLLN